ncbi:MAG: hypothetical protein OXC31_20545 [Spirochaetaceae bacterium]|nr:hypothetical protein [Spirochaetaceae bacterium]
MSRDTGTFVMKLNGNGYVQIRHMQGIPTMMGAQYDGRWFSERAFAEVLLKIGTDLPKGGGNLTPELSGRAIVGSENRLQHLMSITESGTHRLGVSSLLSTRKVLLCQVDRLVERFSFEAKERNDRRFYVFFT